MRKILSLAVIGGAMLAATMAAPAAADGMKAKKPAPMAHEERPHVGNWGGLYFGVNVGVEWHDNNWTIPDDYYYSSSSNSYKNDDSQGILGGHIGLQHQFGRIVVGVEASYSGTGVFGNEWHGSACFDGSDVHCQNRVNSLFTIGPRLGIAHEHLLFYVTGGYASAQVHSRGWNTYYGYEVDPRSRRHDGWFLGAGLEWMLHDRWVLGLEYLHVDLDKARHGEDSYYGCTYCDNARDVATEMDIIRARLSFKLGRKEHVEALK